MTPAKRSIRIKQTSFLVEDDGIAENYSDVTKMFYTLELLKLPINPIIFDVGANIGIYSLTYATLFRSASVHAFEPLPSTFSVLERNIRLNPKLAKRITPHEFGFSEKSAILRLSIPNANQHRRYTGKLNSGLYSVHSEGDGFAVPAKFLRLDEFFDSQQLPTLDFLKIDVEGHEFEVLKGASNTINQFRPIIVMEFNELTRALSRHSVSDFNAFFHQFGYCLYGLEYGWQKTLTPISALSQAMKISDVVCVYHPECPRISAQYGSDVVEKCLRLAEMCGET